MRKTALKNTLIASLFSLAITGSLKAQTSDIGLFLSGSTDDAEKIMGAYVKPFTNAFGYNLNAGWYNTAKVHSLLGFDINLGASVAFIPTADKEFDASTLGLSGQVGTPSMAPTIAGSKEEGPSITYSALGRPFVSYNTPGGINMRIIPSPMIQVGIGLIKGTEIMGRFVPELKLGDAGKIGLWGVGVKHSIKQWIPVIDDIPFLNLSAQFGYTKLNSSYEIDLDPNSGDIYSGITFTPAALAVDYDNQQMDLAISSWTANAIVSIDIPIITVYVGAGVSNTSTNLKMLGNYPIPNAANFNGTQFQVVGSSSGANKDIYVDPVDITIKPGIKPRVNGGLKLKLGIVGFNFDYIYSDYSIVTAGLGISFR